MRIVAVELLQSNDMIVVPRNTEIPSADTPRGEKLRDEKSRVGSPGAFDVLRIVKVEVGKESLGFELRIIANNIITNEPVALRIPAGGFVLSPDVEEIIQPVE